MHKILPASLLLTVLWAAAPSPAVPQESPPPLTNEDVVRMVVQGRGESEILRIIAASPADFELDREMQEELRRAGVTERILSAMRERQAEAGVRPPAPPPASPEPALRGKLLLTFAPPEEEKGKNEGVSFEMVRKVPPWALQRLSMEEKAEVEDLALFVACATPEHVPDHWQDRSPLRDFTRHGILLFRPGSRPGRAKGFEVLSLELPPSLEVEAPEGTHRLLVGVAARIGSDWHAVASDDRREVPVLAGKTTTIRIRLKGRLKGMGMSGAKEEQALTIEGVDEPGGKP